MPAPAAVPHLTSLVPPKAPGANVLCLHGLFAGSWVFDALLPRIAARGYPAHAISYRGHPPNAPIASIGKQSVTDFCRDAADAARSLDRPIVIGHSLGGLIALLLAGNNLTRAVVLVSAAPARGIAVFSPGLLLRMARHFPSLLFSQPLKPGAGDIDALVLNCVPREQRAALRERFVPDSGRAARQAALGVFRVPPRAVRAPMLVIGADKDRFIPVGVAEKLARKYGAQLHIARGHGHFLFAEPGWELEADVMLDWVDALPRVVRDKDITGENPRSVRGIHPAPTHTT
jgi:non-heme chloroperoxidase